VRRGRRGDEEGEKKRERRGNEEGTKSGGEEGKNTFMFTRLS
jgi:hypothetical protein